MVSSRSNEYYIICEDLFKIYKIADLEVVALRGLDLRVPMGELMAIVGVSGSGKTTLLNILGGLDAPTAGKAIVGNRNLLKMSDRSLVSYRRQDVGFIWQQVGRNLVPYLTVYQNVELPLILLGWSRRKRRQRVQEMLEAVGLSHRRQHRPDRLSGGEQQRVAIARALVNDPTIVLADEPTGNLDSAVTQEIMSIFRELNNDGITVVMVTHEMDIAARANRTIRLLDGQIVSDERTGKKTE